MRLVILGFASSIHIARYMGLLADTGWDVHLFDSLLSTSPHPELRDVTLHPATPCEAPVGSGLTVVDPPPTAADGFAGRAAHLRDVLADVRPHVVHSHEIQHGGAIVDRLRRDGGIGAPWLVTNWGSDITWYGRDPQGAPRIRSVLRSCDYYGSECHRDVALARALGLRGRVVGVWPVTGGIDVTATTSLRAPGPTSARRAIAVKGPLGTFGVGDVAFSAVERCADLLEGWELCAHYLSPELEERAHTVADAGHMRYTLVSFHDARQSTHDEVLAMFGRARVAVALNRTDALSTSFLEAMAMGAFPVQSSSSCGNEITPSGRGALFVRATDVDSVADALRRALTDDALVDEGAVINSEAVIEHVDRRRIRSRVLDAYERIVVDAAVGAI